MRVFLFLLALLLPLALYTLTGRFFLNLPYWNFRWFLGGIFLLLAGLMIKNQRFVLGFFFLLIALTLTIKGELFFEDYR